MYVQAYEPWVGYSRGGARATIVRFSLHDSDKIVYYEYQSFNARMTRDIQNADGDKLSWEYSVIGGSDSPQLFQPLNPKLQVTDLYAKSQALCLASWKLQGKYLANFGLTVYTMDGPENFHFYFTVQNWEQMVDPYEHGYCLFISSEKYSKRIPMGMTKKYHTWFNRKVDHWDGD
jgi:hypothetical protein